MTHAPKLLFADPKGRVMEHPYLIATLRSGEELVPPQDKPIALPAAGRLVHLPGRLPVGLNPDSGELELVREMKVGGKTFVPNAVGALLPPGYTRTFLPGEVKGSGPVLPQWAYTAAAWGEKGPLAWAIHTDRRSHWEPEAYSTPELQGLVSAHMERFPDSRVLKQLKTCALLYRCFTSQNIFYARDEGAIPASVMCNARCVGCISDQPADGPPASHERMDDGPSAEEMAAIGLYHLEHAPGRTMVSFGQGCEGEPLTRWKFIAESIRLMRAKTDKGSININTNASLTHGLRALLDAGLDAVRVSLNSASKGLYEAYYKPVKYGWEDVEASIALARERGAYLALNLLLFPGVTDREGEVQALENLVRKYRVDQVQTRSLCIDPLQYLEVARGVGAGGEPVGIRTLLQRLKAARPGLIIGNFARGLDERENAAGSPEV
ncbi:radical SAM domain-containing protein [Corallococcus coralloides DSM 2259]|uniref:Radical SAM domain-containing protein n=1 Tax=Corallococcus coralloides (strain ATCC 25202 / DSM 2259 / NBRC 100086 / M2) TaxID=1144275 RepID=H8MR63_CORCM|nr:radical SAM protein [Corallococcus coralloides]AFE05460.1 radical SAM domain-containing protein [Corallococcus coralloides DSM 2259]